MRQLWMAGLFALTTAASAEAEVPKVMTDIAPVQSLVSMVMGDLGAPEVLLPKGASPHDYAMRPSDAGGLAQADLLIWIGADLTPWLERAWENLAPDARSLELVEDSGDGHDHKGHSHDEHDAHLWLDPEFAIDWLGDIASVLSALDPENAAVYAENAARSQAEITKVADQIHQDLGQMKPMEIWVYHDAYAAFDAAFNVGIAGALTAHEAVTPGARKLQQMRASFASAPGCLLVGPSENIDRVRNLTQELDVKLTEADHLGDLLDRGPEQYTKMLRALAQSILKCRE